MDFTYGIKKYLLIFFYLLLIVAVVVVVLGAVLYVWNKRPNPYYDPNKPYTQPQGFVNLAVAARQPKDRKSLATMRQAYKQLSKQKEKVRADAAKVPWMAVNQETLHHLQTSKGTGFTWLGHSTVLLQVAGKNIIMDPNFSEWLGVKWVGKKRLTPPPLAIKDLPPIDAVFISHNHHDHLDSYSVKYIAAHNPKAIFFVPLGLKTWFRWHGISQVVEMDWWGETQLQNENNISIFFVPAQHWSTRYILDRNRSLWGGFVVKSKDLTFYYRGIRVMIKQYSRPLVKNLAR